MIIFRRDSNLSYRKYYLLYVLHYNVIGCAVALAVVLWWVFVMDDYFQADDFVYNYSRSFGWVVLLYSLLKVGHKLGSKVEAVKIDEEKREIHVEYVPFFLWEEELVCSIDDVDFSYDYTMEYGAVWRYFDIFVPVHTVEFVFHYKTGKIVFHDAAGWRRSQLMEFYDLLFTYRESEKSKQFTK